MSHSSDAYYAVYCERPVKARKSHTCSACKDPIAPGHQYFRVSWIFEGKAEGIKRCARCQIIHDHLKDVAAPYDMWPAEKLNCGEEYREHWGVEPPEEIAALAFALPGEVTP